MQPPKSHKSDIECLKSVTTPESITMGIGTRQCHFFRKQIFDRISPIAYDVAYKYLKITREFDYVRANQFLGSLSSELKIKDLNLTWDKNELKAFAAEKASSLMKDISGLSKCMAVPICKSRISKYGLVLPHDYSDSEIIETCCSNKYWFVQVKSIAAQKLENTRRSLDLVHNSVSPYCSNSRLRDYQWEQEQSMEFMKNNSFCNANGELISMLDAYNANVSNPAIRRAELMVRIKGTEEYSKLLEHCGVFYTITAASKYHSHYKSGKSNPKYAGFDVKEANEHLCNQWKKARAQFHRDGLEVYGLRVVEPHHDGTPHWHLMLFMPVEQMEAVTQILKGYAFEHEPNEKGASKSRFKAEKIDPKKGSAQDYIAKYICKNIDGEFIDEDKYGNDAKLSSQRIRAWSSLFRIRQFQFIGGPSVSLWRQLRKLEITEDGAIEDIRVAADSSDWLSYLVMMGGHNIPRSERPLSLEYELSLKQQYQNIQDSKLSNHAYNRVPKYIRSFCGLTPLPDKGWFLISSPPDQVVIAPNLQVGCNVDEGAGGNRRSWGGAPSGDGPPIP
ncbi:MAG: hypothetical protein ACJAS1_005257 [Oleiphilaceae bacterium]